ncbi:hypothetical protein TcCL_NonESM11220 [Trypanosoma cruzi]|nr:hypothetical protein TcCL_NonESM11220 [Trypanosoma cruzi]
MLSHASLTLPSASSTGTPCIHSQNTGVEYTSIITAQWACKVLAESCHCVGWQGQRNHTSRLLRRSNKIAAIIQLIWASQAPCYFCPKGCFNAYETLTAGRNAYAL